MRPLPNAPFAQFRRQAQILILKILNVFLWLKFSPFLALNKMERFAKVSFFWSVYRVHLPLTIGYDLLRLVEHKSLGFAQQ